MAAGFVLGTLAATTAAGLGVLFSLHARTVREASQRFAYTLVALLFVVSAVGRHLASGMTARVEDWTSHETKGRILLVAVGALAAVAGAVLVLGLVTYRRARLLQADG